MNLFGELHVLMERSDRFRRKMPEEVRQHHTQEVSIQGEDIRSVVEEFKQYVLPYGSGNTHPGFMGWVQGGGVDNISPSLISPRH